MLGGEVVAPDAARLFDLKGRRVLITGAAHGLGLATATAFAGAGAQVAAIDIDGEQLREVADAHQFAYVAEVDIADDAAVEAAVAGAAAALGGIDVVVNAAACYPLGRLATDPPDRLASVLDINVVGTARVTRAACPYLVASGKGRVINFASVMFFTAVPAGLGAYVTSKGAVIAMSRALARELGPDGVSVNVIAPGAFPTRAERAIDVDQKAYDQQLLDAQCIKRRGREEDIACAALFLGSDAASFISGQVLLVDGGWIFH